jgi:hypothetical protein
MIGLVADLSLSLPFVLSREACSLLHPGQTSGRSAWSSDVREVREVREIH